MSRTLRMGLVALGILLLGAAGVPGPCVVNIPGLTIQTNDQADNADGADDSGVPDESGLLPPEQVSDTLQSLDQQGFATLDFGGVQATDEAPFFGESAAAFQAVSANDVPDDPEVRPPAPEGAERGMLAGRFLTDQEGASSFESPGTFRGVWATGDFTVVGFMKGVFHPITEEGGQAAKENPPTPPIVVAKGAFYGKYIDTEGKFMGILRGIYAKLEDGRSFFVGKWVGQNGEVIGGLRGIWRDLENEPGGILLGHWARFPVNDIPGDLADYPFAGGDFGGLTNSDESPFFGEDRTLYHRIPLDGMPDGDGPPPGSEGHARGWLAGWFKGANGGTSSTEGGVFRGRWATADLQVLGVLRGHYEPLDGQNGGLFYGKVISVSDIPENAGKFRGMLRGRYGALPDGRTIFIGHWFNKNLEDRGPVLGRWQDIPELGVGVFKGHWIEVSNTTP